MNTVLNVDVLKTMSADELEDYRAAGEDFRRVLSHAVMRDLPDGRRTRNTGVSLVAFSRYRSVFLRCTAILMWRYAAPVN